MHRSSLFGLFALCLLPSSAHCEPGDWLGAAPVPSTPVETSKSMLGVPVDVAGARIYRVDVDPRKISRSSVFSPDSKFLFLLQNKVGVLQIEMPSFRLVRTLSLPCNGGSVALSKEGLVVGSSDAATIWVVEPQSLKVVRSFKLEETRQITASPKSSIAFVGSGNKIYSVDLRSGDAVAYQSQNFQVDQRVGTEYRSGPLGSFGTVVLAPEGNMLFTSYFGTIYRFAIQGRTLTPEANSDRIGLEVDPTRPVLALSPDGRYAALPGNNGSFQGEFRSFGSNQTWIFKTNDLREPVLRLEGTNNPRAVAFDPAAGRLYVTHVPGFRPALRVYGSTGQLQKAITLPGKDNDFLPPWDFSENWLGGGWTNGSPLAVYPGGNHVLVGTEAGLFWFDLPTNFVPDPPKPDTARNAPRANRNNQDGFGQGGFNF